MLKTHVILVDLILVKEYDNCIEDGNNNKLKMQKLKNILKIEELKRFFIFKII
jgi:hypothetical protein